MKKIYRDRILAVANSIETEAVEGLGFNMATFMQPIEYADYKSKGKKDCGTVACIAGWAYAHAHGLRELESCMAPAQHAATYFGIERSVGANGLSQSYHLFYAKHRRNDNGMQDISKKQAVATLRNFAYTGEVNWMVAQRDVAKMHAAEEEAN